MGNFHLYHISFFDALLKGLDQSGVSIQNLSYQSYIKRFDLENPDTYLPKEVGYEFVDKVKKTQAIDCISGEFYAGFEVSDLSEYGEYLSNCPNLYSILINAIKYDYLIQTSGKLELKTKGATSWFYMKHMDAPSSGRLISEKINTAMIVKAFQMVLGPQWTPLELNITTADAKWVSKLFPSLNFRINLNCDAIGICFKTNELAAKNRYYNDNPELEHRDLTSIEGTAEWVLNSMKGNYLPTIEEFAKYFGYSKRTAIRKFTNTGISFKHLIEKHVFIRSLELLSNPNLSVDQISLELGYSHPSNFIRAFKRWTNSTPSKFRRDELNLSNTILN